MQITIREPGSAITHFIGMMMAIFAAVPLLVKAGVTAGTRTMFAMGIFRASMILLYGRKRHLPLRQSHRAGPCGSFASSTT